MNAGRNLVVGLVFLGGLAVLGAATLSVSSLPFLSKAEALSVRFANVDNLKPGDDVLVRGCRVGQVQQIRFDPSVVDAPVHVEVTVPQEIRTLLGPGTVISVQSLGPLGGHYLEIMPPVGATPGQPLETFRGETPGDFFKRASTLVEDLTVLVRKNERNITDTIEGLKNAVAEVREAFRAANAGEGTIGLLLRDPEVRARAGTLISDMSETVRQLRADVTDNKGIISYLLRDEKAKQSLQATVERLESVVKDVREGNGVASRLINDKDLADRLAATLEDFHEVVHKVNTGQGTLGQIVNSPKAWDEFVRILVLARETIEDIREQAPVSTFVNAAFSAF